MLSHPNSNNEQYYKELQLLLLGLRLMINVAPVGARVLWASQAGGRACNMMMAARGVLGTDRSAV